MALIPYLTVDDASAAFAFYAAALGADEVSDAYQATDGRPRHTALKVGSDVFYLSEEHAESGAYAPATLGHSTAALVLWVDNADDTYAAAIAVGATADREPADEPWGERHARFIDPFGHRWSLLSD